MAGMFGAVLGEKSERNELTVLINDARRQCVLRGVFDHDYANQIVEVIFDSSGG